jgi:HlyD family secretion protein
MPAPPAQNNPLFRKAALDRLSSPEQLDMLVQVTRTPAWMALATLGALLLTAVVWGIFGSIPTKVSAEGILISRGGIFDVLAVGNGTVGELRVREGDVVEEGQIVARVDQPDMERELEGAKADRVALGASFSSLQGFTKKDLGLRSESTALQRAKQLDTIAFSEDRLKALAEQITSEEELLQRGLITKQTLLQTKQSYFSTKDQLERARNDLKQLDVQELSQKSQSQQELGRTEQQIRDTERRIALLESQLERNAVVRSPYRGTVVELRVNRGDVVHSGEAVLSLRPAGREEAREGLQALVYVPPTEGKSIQPGMEVQVSPSTANKEEVGFLVGRVTYVSEFPATFQGMMRVLSNSDLVKRLSGDGAPFAVYVELEADTESASGYRWSSIRGRSVKVAAGTLSDVSITTRKRRPISLVIPLIREYVGI